MDVMKNRIFAIALMFCLMAGAMAVAQEQRQKAQAGKKETLTSEQMARRRAEHMGKELKLDAKQIEAVYEVKLNTMKREQAQQAEKKKIKQDETAQMKQILTEEQYKQWNELRRPARPMESRRPRTVEGLEKGPKAAPKK